MRPNTVPVAEIEIGIGIESVENTIWIAISNPDAVEGLLWKPQAHARLSNV